MLGPAYAAAPEGQSSALKFRYDSAAHLIYSYFGTGAGLRDAEYMLDDAEREAGAAPLIWLGRAELKFRVWRVKQSYAARQEAEYLVGKALELDNNLAAAYALLGQIEWSRGCITCGKLRAEQAVAIDAGSAEGVYLRAAVHAAVGDDASSQRFLRQALQAVRSPARRVDMLISFAVLLVEHKKPDRAEKLLREALESAGPEQALPVRVQYAAFLMFESGKIGEALEHARVAAKGGSAEAKELLDLGGYIEWAKVYLQSGRNPKGYTTAGVAGYLPVQQAFIIAAGHKSTALFARALLKAKAIDDVDVKDDASDTALIAATRADETELVRELVLRKAAVNARNGKSERPLTFSVSSANAPLVELLLKQGAEVNYTDVDGRSPLSIAVQKGDVQLVRLLLRAKARMPSEGQWSSTRMLTTAGELGNVTVIEVLLNNGAAINGKDGFGRTALIAAIIAGQLDAVKALLAHGADSRAQYLGASALDFAERLGEKRLIDLLKEARQYGT
ncbi:MAG: Pfs, and Ankyrin domain protein [Betaproteobacteria bacterium]|nr:Pfs, and Ankyrin domain protein [Betaproteobacteria bacterium]